jgi:hypothetical protein
VEAFVQPATREFQFPIYGSLRGAQQLRSFFRGKSKEEAKFHHTAFPRVQLVQFIQYTIEIHDLDLTGVNPGQPLVQWNGNPSVPLLPSLGASMIEQNTAHQSRGETVEMFPIFEPQATLAYELQKQLVHNAGGLQDIFRTLSSEKGACDLPQFWVDDIEKAINSVGPPLAPFLKKFGNFTSVAQAGESFLEECGRVS